MSFPENAREAVAFEYAKRVTDEHKEVGDLYVIYKAALAKLEHLEKMSKQEK